MAGHEPPDDGEGLTLTRELLNRRSRHYRDLVVAVGVVGLTVPVAALVLDEWRFLLTWLLIAPIVGLFLALDARSVVRWRSSILDGWVAGVLDLDALVEGLTSIKLLPARTIAGLVDPLPTRARLGCFPDPKPLVREALAATIRAIDGLQLSRLVSAVAALTAAAALVALAAAAGVGLAASWSANCPRNWQGCSGDRRSTASKVGVRNRRVEEQGT